VAGDAWSAPAAPPTLAAASLSEDERRVVLRLVELLREEFGDRLRAVWLYGSRARGEPPREESDVDLLVIAEPDTGDDGLTAILLIDRAVQELGISPYPIVSIHVWTPEWLAHRRRIESFFIQEVDRDKIALFGDT